MINVIRYSVQALVLTVSVPVTLVLGFSFIPLWNNFGPFSLILPACGIAVSYVAMGLFEAVDDWADSTLVHLAA